MPCAVNWTEKMTSPKFITLNSLPSLLSLQLIFLLAEKWNQLTLHTVGCNQWCYKLEPKLLDPNFWEVLVQIRE